MVEHWHASFSPSPAGPMTEFLMTSGAVQRGLVVLDTMIIDELALSILEAWRKYKGIGARHARRKFNREAPFFSATVPRELHLDYPGLLICPYGYHMITAFWRLL
jgi:hypothetical protein